MFNLERTGLSSFPHLWNENTIPEGFCGTTNRAVCLKYQTQKWCACSTHTEPFGVRHSSQSSCLPSLKVWPWGSCLISLCTGDLAFLDEEQATYITELPWAPNVQQNAQHLTRLPHITHSTRALLLPLLLQAGSTPAPREAQDLLNLPDTHPESRPFSGQESSWIQGNMDICTTRFFSVSGGKEIFLLPPLCSIAYTLISHRGGNINPLSASFPNT